MGQVYRGVQPTIGSRVAIKVLSAQWARDPVLTERFFAEARAVNVIRHEHIVNVLDLARLPDGRPYIVLEFLDGQPLSQVILQRGPLPLGGLVQFCLEVLAGLGAAHAKGIVHRDLKPDNLFVSPVGHAKILDFGIAKLRPEISSVDAATRTGSLLGTPHYMSPEQAMGRTADHRADLYAMGVILFEGATGQRPFSATSLYDLLRQHVEARPPSPCLIRPDLHPGLERIIYRAMEKAPAARFATAEEFASSLGQILPLLPRDSFRSLGTPATSTGQPGTPSGAAVQAIALAGSAPEISSVHQSTALGQSHTVTLDPTRARKGSAGPWIALVLGLVVLAGLGGFAVLGLAIVGVLVAKDPGGHDDRRPVSTSEKAPSGPEKAGNDQNRYGQQPPGFDPEKVSVGEHFATAERGARAVFSDAELVRIDITGVNARGLVNTRLSSGSFSSSVLFRWRSPSRSERPASLPLGAQHEAECLYYYMVSDDGISSYTVSHLGCEELTVPRPRCTVPQIWQRAVAAGAPQGNYIGDVSYYRVAGQPVRWYVRIGSYSGFLPDQC